MFNMKFKMYRMCASRSAILYPLSSAIIFTIEQSSTAHSPILLKLLPTHSLYIVCLFFYDDPKLWGRKRSTTVRWWCRFLYFPGHAVLDRLFTIRFWWWWRWNNSVMNERVWSARKTSSFAMLENTLQIFVSRFVSSCIYLEVLSHLV